MFASRQQAGELLAQKLQVYQGKKTIVIGLTRGGVVVAKEISQILDLPLSPLIVKKIGAPGNSELAIGAITVENTSFIDRELVNRIGVSSMYLKKKVKEKQQEIGKLVSQISTVEQPSFHQKEVIIVDDGVATGATMEVVIKYLKRKKAAKIIIAVPVIAKDIYQKLKKEVFNIVALEKPEILGAVGEFYQEFSQVSDEDVIKLLNY